MSSTDRVIWLIPDRMAETDRAVVRRRRGYWIRRMRERAGLTQDGLAELLGYAPRSGGVIARWESGERAVPSDRFPGLARALSLPPQWLVEPPITDDDRLDELVREASAEERADWERAQAEGRAAGVEPVSEREKRPA